ncbi:MAG: tetraacyldisaccharide 4'-kinase [Acidobacteria bacterium]|nr:tetraacyldisaccharide 4'-kinase [Acidobacteriota bacterium]
MSSTPALAPLSFLYGAVVRARLALYRAGALDTHRINAPVISVGNITSGGTGKTPLVEWLARAVAREGLRPCILTRGYGRADARRRVVVSDGEKLLADAREGGDEPRLLAEALRGVASVVSDADRVAAARWALANLKAEAFILDDAFQHLRIARDLNIVTLDATEPWGGGHMLPRGRLREPPGGLRRADCIVITRADLARDLDSLRAEAERLGGGRALVLTSRVKTLQVRPLTNTSSQIEFENEAVPQPVGVFCAVGNPEAFFRHLRNDGYEVCDTRAFPDHHQFTQGEIDELSRGAVRSGARALLATAKDAVKLHSLRFALPLYVVEIGLEFNDESGLESLVREALNSRARR